MTVCLEEGVLVLGQRQKGGEMKKKKRERERERERESKREIHTHALHLPPDSVHGDGPSSTSPTQSAISTITRASAMCIFASMPVCGKRGGGECEGRREDV